MTGLISLFFFWLTVVNYEVEYFYLKNKLQLPKLILYLSAFNGLSEGLNRSDSWCVFIVLHDAKD